MSVLTNNQKLIMGIENFSNKIDCYSVCLTRNQKIELEKRNDLIRFVTFKECVPIDYSTSSFCWVAKISVADYLETVHPDHVFDSLLHCFNFSVKKLKVRGLFLLNHLELCYDFPVDFEEHFSLFQSFILYYTKKVNAKKAVLISDLAKSMKSGLSTKRKNIQVVIYNKTYEVEGATYNRVDSEPLTRLEFRFFSLRLPCNGYAFKAYCFYCQDFFKTFNPEIFARIENDLSLNLFENFKRDRNLYFKNSLSANSKFSIKNFLLTQKDYCISKKIIREFYEKLRDDGVVVGSFDDYYHKILVKVHFNLIKAENLKNFFELVSSRNMD